MTSAERNVYRAGLLIALVVSTVVSLALDRDPVEWTAGVVFGACVAAVIYEINRERPR